MKPSDRMIKEMKKVIEAILKELTLEEKIDMIHGNGLFCTKAVPRLGIPAIRFSDGPMGVRQEFENDQWNAIGNHDDQVSYLPSNSALAASWNRELAYKNGKVLGEETRGRGKDVILAPGINIKRSPLCGRNFEYMSEDPYLTGEMAVPVIQGIQESDAAACVKHFVANNQETERLWVEALVSDRAMREIYLPAFQKAVQKGRSYSIMGAYNRYKGEHGCESKSMLNKVLRDEWKYDGMIVSDWGGVHSTKEAATSALDIEMSVTNNFDEYCMAEPLKEAVRNGEVTEALIDKKVCNILRLMIRLHMLTPEHINEAVGYELIKCSADCKQTKRSHGSYNTAEHHRAALEVARESVVLLKNEKHRLPLKRDQIQRVLVIGDNADRVHSSGGGSAEIKALYEITPLMGIKKQLGGNAEVTYLKGYYADDCVQAETDVNWQADSLENGGGSVAAGQAVTAEVKNIRKNLREEAVKYVQDRSYDTVILIGGQNHQQDLEGQDRQDMKLPYGQDELIKAVLEVRPDTVLVLMSGSPAEMPWIKQADTLVWHWYAGMEGGTALAEVLFGEVNPSGKLPETFPIQLEDCPAHRIGEFPGGSTVDYREGIFVGYRYFDSFQIPVLFPFGHGLSYTEFVYTDLEIVQNTESDKGTIQVQLNVTNTGNLCGKETVQIYVGRTEQKSESARNRRLTADAEELQHLHVCKELKGFEKVELEAGETKMILIELDQNAFSYYREEKHAFVTESGLYSVYAGSSSEDIRLEKTVELTFD